MSNRLFIAMPVKYTGINLFNTIIKRLKDNGCSWDYELHVLFNGASKNSIEYKQFNIAKGVDNRIFIHYLPAFKDILSARVKLINEFLKSNCSHIWMIDPDDVHEFNKVPTISEAPLADIHRYGCPIESDVIYPDEYNEVYRLRNFSIYHVWHSIFNKRSMKRCINDLIEISENFVIDQSEDFVINLVCFKYRPTIQFHKDKFVTPVYDNNPYSNYSDSTDFDKYYKKEQQVFASLDKAGVFTSKFEREFHYNKIMAELGMHCYIRSLKKVPQVTCIAKDIRYL